MEDEVDDTSDPPPFENAAAADKFNGRGLTRFNEGICDACATVRSSATVADGSEGYDNDFDNGIFEGGIVVGGDVTTVVVVSATLQLIIGVFRFLDITFASTFAFATF